MSDTNNKTTTSTTTAIDANSDDYYYKILDAAPPHPLPDTLPPTALDAQDGFIHLSVSHSLPLFPLSPSPHENKQQAD